MGTPSSFSVGRVAGWCLAAFVFGVAAHSTMLYWHPSAYLWLALVPILSAALFVTPTRWKIAIAVFLSFAFGVWRFDVAHRPTLRPYDGKLFIASNHGTGTDVFSRMRQSVTKRIEARFPPADARLIAGILYGDAQFTTEERKQFVNAGLLHLVAVSGSNVTIVIGFVLGGVLAAGIGRRRAFWAASAALIAFVAFVGFAASVARAAFMGWLALVARQVGRLSDPTRLLLVAATILLLINPYQLCFDAGFALSFLAMWGLISWSAPMEALLKRVPNIFGIRQALAATISATVWTAPYLAWGFGRLSLAGLLTNLLALPAVPFFMFASAVAAAWGPLPGGSIISLPALGFSKYIYAVAGLTRFAPWLSFTVVRVDLSTLIATYILLVVFTRQWRRKNELSTEK